MSRADDFFADKPEKVVKSVDIERANGKVHTIYFDDMTFRDLNKLQKKHPNFLNEQNADGMVDLVIMKAMTAEGEKFFDVGDKFKLMSENFAVVPTMFAAMFNTIPVDEQEKN